MAVVVGSQEEAAEVVVGAAGRPVPNSRDANLKEPAKMGQIPII